MYKYIVCLLSSLIIQGCVVQPTNESKAIRMVDRQSDYKCKFIATVTGSGSMGWTTAHDAEGAMNEIRNEAAKVGANAVRIVNADSNMSTSVVIGEALLCEFNE